jgi:chemotaxis protein methyltransferase CheR
MSTLTAMEAPAWARAALSPEDFQRARGLLRSIAGIALNDSKKTMVASRLTKRLRATGLDSFPAYLDRVENESGEWPHFVNALTTNLTAFFRESYHFPILVEHVLKAHARAPGRPVTVWSAGCSTGQEPYSMAIAFAEAFGTTSPPVRIIASDIDTEALAFAERGIYPVAKLDGISPQRLKQFFQRGTGPNEGSARIHPSLRARIEFKHINLSESKWDVPETVAAIFCRNVMIYFSRETQAALVRRYAQRLGPDGLLFAGHSENLHYVAGDVYRACGRTVYRVISGGAA